MTREKSWLSLLFKSLFFLLLCYWFSRLLADSQPWIFLDNANLLFHEAGHFLFTFFGEFIDLLAGSFTQITIPLGIGIYFLLHAQYFAAAFSLFWTGDNLVNVGVYIKDANTLALPLIGGIHDWQAILSRVNALSQAETLGTLVVYLGLAAALGGLCLMAVLLVKSFCQHWEN